jgi:hypothetical protein
LLLVQSYAPDEVYKLAGAIAKLASINLRKLVLSHTGSINLGFILREDLLLCSSYLPLGVPNWAVIYSPSTPTSLLWPVGLAFNHEEDICCCHGGGPFNKRGRRRFWQGSPHQRWLHGPTIGLSHTSSSMEHARTDHLSKITRGILVLGVLVTLAARGSVACVFLPARGYRPQRKYCRRTSTSACTTKFMWPCVPPPTTWRSSLGLARHHHVRISVAAVCARHGPGDSKAVVSLRHRQPCQATVPATVSPG